jgi:hypothetical protein
MLDDAVAMRGATHERLQDQQLECAWQEIRRCVGQSHQRMMGMYKGAPGPVNCNKNNRRLSCGLKPYVKP